MEKLHFLLIPSLSDSWLMEAGHGKTTPKLEGLPGAGQQGGLARIQSLALKHPKAPEGSFLLLVQELAAAVGW